MYTERGLLFGILARHAGLIDGPKLIEVLRLWSAHYRSRPLADVLEDRGWIASSQREQVSALLEGLVRDHGGEVEVALSAVLDGSKGLLVTDEEPDVREAVLEVLGAAAHPTLVHTDAANADATVSAAVPGDRPYLLMEALPTGQRYTRTSLHASGGMGSVWLAHDANIGRDVALKELRAESAANKSVPLRFLREARITGQLEHPGVVPVYEIGRDAATGRPFYTMRFVRGRTLTEASEEFHAHRQAGRDEPLEFINLLSACVSVCHTVAYAHSHGIVHRDLKGENIILGDFGEVIVVSPSAWRIWKTTGPSRRRAAST
jgi:serine/threonine-protein kinase